MSTRQKLLASIAMIALLVVTILIYLNTSSETTDNINESITPSINDIPVTITDLDTENNRLPVSGSYIPDDKEESSEVSTESSEESSEESHDKSSESSESEALASDETQLDPSIYNVDLIEANGIEAINPSDYASIDELVYDLIAEYGINTNQIGLSFYNFQTDEFFTINPQQYIIAASTAKVPIAAIYLDLIEEGYYSLDSYIPYDSTAYSSLEPYNSNGDSAYTIEDLIHDSIVYSDNSSWYALAFNYINNFDSVRQGILNFSGYYSGVSDIYYSDNYTTAEISQEVLIKVANNPSYEPLTQLMRQTEPDQLFSSYVNNDNMATKYGRLEGIVNDTGIYYENNQAQYSLVVLTDEVDYADGFIELLNLRINQWFRANYI